MRALIVSAIAVVALTGFTCGGEAEPALTTEPDALERSAGMLRFAPTFLARYTVTFDDPGGAASTITYESAYEDNFIVYSHQTVTGSLRQFSEFDEQLFIPQDLYMHRTDGQWFVLSPWHQGTTIEDFNDFEAESPPDAYKALVDDVDAYEVLPSKTLDGVPLHRIDAEAVLDGEEVTARFWLYPNYRPHKVVISESDPSIAVIIKMEFLGYDEPVVAPERPTDTLPLRDVAGPVVPCQGEAFAGCLAAQTALMDRSVPSCSGEGKRLCLLPMGQVSPALVDHLVAYYREQYGIEIIILTPVAIPDELANELRGQVDSSAGLDYLLQWHPEIATDPTATVIGLTPVDVYMSSVDYRYVFGTRFTSGERGGIVSSFRMDPVIYGEALDEELFHQRVRKMFTKYVGLLYFDLPTSMDPTSPMYDLIRGPADLDRIQEPLPVQ